MKSLSSVKISSHNCTDTQERRCQPKAVQILTRNPLLVAWNRHGKNDGGGETFGGDDPILHYRNGPIKKEIDMLARS